MLYVSDLISNIKVCLKSGKEFFYVKKSNLILEILNFLLEDGFIQSFVYISSLDKFKVILKRYQNNFVIKSIKLETKSGRRKYIKVEDFIKNYRWPIYSLISTSCGLVSSKFIYKNYFKLNSLNYVYRNNNFSIFNNFTYFFINLKLSFLIRSKVNLSNLIININTFNILLKNFNFFKTLLFDRFRNRLLSKIKIYLTRFDNLNMLQGYNLKKAKNHFSFFNNYQRILDYNSLKNFVGLNQSSLLLHFLINSNFRFINFYLCNYFYIWKCGLKSIFISTGWTKPFLVNLDKLFVLNFNLPLSNSFNKVNYKSIVDFNLDVRSKDERISDFFQTLNEPKILFNNLNKIKKINGNNSLGELADLIKDHEKLVYPKNKQKFNKSKDLTFININSDSLKLKNNLWVDITVLNFINCFDQLFRLLNLNKDKNKINSYNNNFVIRGGELLFTIR